MPEDPDFSEEELGDCSPSFAVPSGLIRLSVGAEAFADLEREMRRGLSAAADAAPA